jgi:hypothetical protein
MDYLKGRFGSAPSILHSPSSVILSYPALSCFRHQSYRTAIQ